MRIIETLGVSRKKMFYFVWRRHQKTQVGRKHNVQYRRGIGKYALIYMHVAFGPWYEFDVSAELNELSFNPVIPCSNNKKRSAHIQDRHRDP